MDEQRRMRRDIAWNVVPVALLAVVGLALQFLIGRWWDEAALGAFNLVSSAFFLFGVIGACGIQFSVLRAVAEHASDADRVAAIVLGALLPNLALAVLATALFAVLAAPAGMLFDSDAVARGMLWAAPGVFCFALNKVLLGVVNGLRRMRAFAVYTSLRYLMLAVGLIGARALDAAPAQLPVIWTVTEVALFCVLVVELLRTVRLARGLGKWIEPAREHVAFGLRGVTATFGFELGSKLDVWLLGAALPEAQVGIYSLASAIAEGAQQLAVVVQNTVNPVMARALASRDTAQVEALVGRTRRWFVPAMIVACGIGALAYPYIVPILVGNEAFTAGAPAFAILMAGTALASPWLPFNQLVLMGARPGAYTAYVLVTLAVAFVACSIAIPPLGMEGAAIGMSAALLAAAVMLRAMARRQFGVRL